MRVGIADPPYIGQSAKHYADHPDFAGEVDHARLLERLRDEFADGWALCLNEPSLPEVLEHCKAAGLDRRRGDYRVMAWVKPFCSFKPGVNPAYAWEPVIVSGGRKRTREQPTVRDWVAANITLKRGLAGAKPPDFCVWLFEVLGLEPGDELVDLFPGSGAIGDAWESYRQGLRWQSGGEQFALFGDTP